MNQHLIAVLKQVTAYKEEYYYHGTSSKLGKKILKEGFDPNPKEKIWDQSKNHLETFSGTYLTTIVEVAGRAAGAAAGKLGGDMWIFEILLNVDKGYIDEDELPGITQYLNSDTEDQDEAIADAIDEWFELGYEDDDNLGLGEPDDDIIKKLTEPLREWAEAEILEDSKEIRKAKEKIIKALQGKVGKMNVDNIKVLEPISPYQIKSVVKIDFDADGNVDHEIIKGKPAGRYFISDIENFNKDEIMTQKELYFD
jgi:hypothetical protein